MNGQSRAVHNLTHLPLPSRVTPSAVAVFSTSSHFNHVEVNWRLAALGGFGWTDCLRIRDDRVKCGRIELEMCVEKCGLACT